MSKKESGAIFHFNFKDVYWNARLETEHARVINLICGQNIVKLRDDMVESSDEDINNSGAPKVKITHKSHLQDALDVPMSEHTSQRLKLRLQHQRQLPQKVVVADMMAGVGPFAVPLTMSRTAALAHRRFEVHANG